MYAYLVDRCTTDKLQDTLNSFGSKGWQATAYFQGGRDWVVVAEQSSADGVSLQQELEAVAGTVRNGVRRGARSAAR